jgi:23S rRNA pseudouridine1911/1915/1917 synthase
MDEKPVENEPPERLDQYVIRQLPELSRSAAVHLIEQGKVSVKGKPADKPGYKLRAGDLIEIDHEAVIIPEIPAIDLPVIYEDRSCVAIDKPAGVLTHSKGAFNPEATVATWLASRVKGMDGDRAGIVHRLDRATSGVMICAKTSEALSWLQKQFSERKVKKVYQAVVSGVPAQAEAVIDMPIERNPRKPQTFRVGANGKAAVTAYRVLKTNGKLSLLELRPTTGRTHQLRVHLRHIGHPILGDPLYDGAKAERLFLHARSLEITLPNKTRKILGVPTPEIFETIVD